MATPSFLLDVPVRELGGWWLHVDCLACGGRSVDMPVRLIEGGKPGLRLGDVLRGLRCKACGRAPSKVTLLDNPADRAPGRPAPGGWRVEIVFPDLPGSTGR